MTNSKRDILTRADVQKLVAAFYDVAMNNQKIGMFFTDVVILNLDIHLPKIIDFWCSLLLGHNVYKGNPMVKHIALNRLERMTDEHFETWLNLWNDTIRKMYVGPVANDAIKRARQIAGLMQHKIKIDQIT